MNGAPVLAADNKYTLRYTGALVPDVYHILMKGQGVCRFGLHLGSGFSTLQDSTNSEEVTAKRNVQ
jgi:fructose-1,6-bisphosphatase